MDKFNETYNKIISEGFFRALRQFATPRINKTTQTKAEMKDIWDALEDFAEDNYFTSLDSIHSKYERPLDDGTVIKLTVQNPIKRNKIRDRFFVFVEYEGRRGKFPMKKSTTAGEIEKNVSRICQNMGLDYEELDPPMTTPPTP